MPRNTGAGELHRPDDRMIAEGCTDRQPPRSGLLEWEQVAARSSGLSRSIRARRPAHWTFLRGILIMGLSRALPQWHGRPGRAPDRMGRWRCRACWTTAAGRLLDAVVPVRDIRDDRAGLTRGTAVVAAALRHGAVPEWAQNWWVPLGSMGGSFPSVPIRRPEHRRREAPGGIRAGDVGGERHPIAGAQRQALLAEHNGHMACPLDHLSLRFFRLPTPAGPSARAMTAGCCDAARAGRRPATSPRSRSPHPYSYCGRSAGSSSC